MTASKSSRARNARAESNAARNRNAPAGRGTVAVKAQGRGDGTGQGRVTATKNGGPASGGSRAQVTWEEPADVTSATGTAVPMWLQLTTFVLALAGLGVSTYLTVAHFTESALLGCSESGVVNCTKVTTSPQSYVFGIPVAVLGLAFFVFAVAVMSPWAWQWQWRRREVGLIRLASVVVGIGFVIYLLYAELFIIGSICLYCTSVHAITFVLFLLTVFAAAAWGIPERQRG